jgi:uncharacterized membrane protein
MFSFTKKNNTEQLVLASLMTALVVVFQCIATSTTFFGPFSTAIGLIPIVIGAVLCGPIIGGWLGFVFALVVLFTGGGYPFLMFNVLGTIITVIAKGVGCGFAAGFVNLLLSRYNKNIAIIAAAVVCPIVNTGIFLLGCIIFFMPYANDIAAMLNIEAGGIAVFGALAFGNFLFELGMNAVLSPVMVKILNVAEMTFKNNFKTSR